MSVMLGDDPDEDLEGYEELQFDRSPNDLSHDPRHDPERVWRAKRNLVVGLVGFIVIMGWVMIVIGRIK